MPGAKKTNGSVLDLNQTTMENFFNEAMPRGKYMKTKTAPEEVTADSNRCKNEEKRAAKITKEQQVAKESAERKKQEEEVKENVNSQESGNTGQDTPISVTVVQTALASVTPTSFDQDIEGKLKDVPDELRQLVLETLKVNPLIDVCTLVQLMKPPKKGEKGGGVASDQLPSATDNDGVNGISSVLLSTKNRNDGENQSPATKSDSQNREEESSAQETNKHQQREEQDDNSSSPLTEGTNTQIYEAAMPPDVMRALARELGVDVGKITKAIKNIQQSLEAEERLKPTPVELAKDFNTPPNSNVQLPQLNKGANEEQDEDANSNNNHQEQDEAAAGNKNDSANDEQGSWKGDEEIKSDHDDGSRSDQDDGDQSQHDAADTESLESVQQIRTRLSGVMRMSAKLRQRKQAKLKQRKKDEKELAKRQKLRSKASVVHECVDGNGDQDQNGEEGTNHEGNDGGGGNEIGFENEKPKDLAVSKNENQKSNQSQFVLPILSQFTPDNGGIDPSMDKDQEELEHDYEHQIEVIAEQIRNAWASQLDFSSTTIEVGDRQQRVQLWFNPKSVNDVDHSDVSKVAAELFIENRSDEVVEVVTNWLLHDVKDALKLHCNVPMPESWYSRKTEWNHYGIFAEIFSDYVDLEGDRIF